MYHQTIIRRDLMRRFMPALAALLTTAVIAGLAYAQSTPCVSASCGYMPLVQFEPTPTPVPPPPPLNTLTIQLADMKPGYSLDESMEITNSSAAAGYPNPNAALKAFQSQGRETSWYVRYVSTDYLFSDAIGVADQVFRYTTADGAISGQNYVLLEVLSEHPEYQEFNTGSNAIGFRRTFSDSGYNFVQFYISVQVGRYVTDVQVIGLNGSVTASRALQYAQIAVDRLAAVPQAQIAEETPANPTSSVPHTVRDGMMSH
jgi:hypothetical protein